MKKAVLILSLAGILLMTFGSGSSRAGKIDVLIDKLVEKGILSYSEAEHVLTQIQKEKRRYLRKIFLPEVGRLCFSGRIC